MKQFKMKQFRIFALMLSMVFFSCEKDVDNKTSVDSSSEGTITAVTLETSTKEIDGAIDDLAIYSSESLDVFGKSESNKIDVASIVRRFGFFRKCADVEVERAGNIFTITITFNGECEDRSGNVITGVVVLTRSNSDSGLESIVAITDLSIHGYVINGTRAYSFVKNNEAGNIEINASEEITIVTEEGTISKVGDRTVEISEGDDIETIEDNVKTVTGSLVYNVLGKEFKMEITSPLVKPATCGFVVSGVKIYTRGEGVSVLDYGDGTCDNLAVLTLADGTQEQILLGGRGVDLDDDSNEDDSDEDDSNGDDSEEDDSNGDDSNEDDSDQDDSEEDDSNEDDSNEDDSNEDDSNGDDSEEDDSNEDDSDEDDSNEDDSEKDDSNEDDSNEDDSNEDDSNGDDSEEDDSDNDDSGEDDSNDDDSNDDNSDEDNSDEDDSNDDNSNEDDSDEDDSNEDDSNEDDSQMSCTLTTNCEVVVFDGTSNLSVESIQSGDVYMIIVRNVEGDVVYEKECTEGGLASLSCRSVQ